MTNDIGSPSSPGAAIPPDDPGRYLTVVSADDEGLAQIGWFGNTYTVLLSGHDTAGQYFLVDMLIPAGRGARPHRHDFEEMFTVLQGQLEFSFRGQQTTVRAGQTVNIPANAPHFFHNASGDTARLLCLGSPAGQEDFFAAGGDRLTARSSPLPQPDGDALAQRVEKIKRLAPQYHTELLDG